MGRKMAIPCTPLNVARHHNLVSIGNSRIRAGMVNMLGSSRRVNVTDSFTRMVAEGL
jgi:hypothetical protein